MTEEYGRKRLWDNTAIIWELRKTGKRDGKYAFRK